MPDEGQGLLALAQSTGMARAMARMGSDERASFGVLSGHGRKTFSLSASQPGSSGRGAASGPSRASQAAVTCSSATSAARHTSQACHRPSDGR